MFDKKSENVCDLFFKLRFGMHKKVFAFFCTILKEKVFAAEEVQILAFFKKFFCFSRTLPIKSEVKGLISRIDCESLLHNWSP